MTGVKEQEEAGKLLFLYAVIEGRKGTSRTEFSPQLIELAEAHLKQCGECQRKLRESGLLGRSSPAAQAVAEAEAYVPPHQDTPEERIVKALLTDTSSLGQAHDQVDWLITLLETQVIMGRALRSHLEGLQRARNLRS